MQKGQVQLLAVGQGDYRALAALGRMTKFEGTLVADLMQPSLPAYRALGAHPKGKDGCAFICEQIFVGTRHGINAIHFHGHKDLVNGVTRSNFMVQGGCLLLDEGCRVTYQHMFTKTSEHWPVEALVAKINEASEGQRREAL